MKDDEAEIVWNDFPSLGVPAMDAEHRKFLARVEELNHAIVEAGDKATVRRTMDSMLAEAATHFRDEEDLLAGLNYPEAAAHAAKHAELAARFGRVVREFDEAELSFVWAVKALQVKQLLVEHLLREDLKYQEFLRARQRLH